MCSEEGVGICILSKCMFCLQLFLWKTAKELFPESVILKSFFLSKLSRCFLCFCCCWVRENSDNQAQSCFETGASLPAAQSPSAQGALPLLQAAVVTFGLRLPWISKHLLCWMCLGSLNQVSFQAPDCPPDSAVSFQRKRRYFRHAVSNRGACCLSNRAAWR